MGNVNMEAKQIHDRTEEGKHQSVADHLKALDAIAASIENIPTFTSDDRAFLEGLPAFPTEDGTKVLTATTSSGETTLSYEEVESGENQIYSSTPVQIGYVGDKPLYRVFVTFDTPITSSDSSYTSTDINSENIELILRGDGINADGTYYGHMVFDPTFNNHQSIGVKGAGTIKYAVFEYV